VKKGKGGNAEKYGGGGKANKSDVDKPKNKG